MKKIIILLTILTSFFYSKAQSKTFTLSPAYKQTFHQGDTVVATAQLITSDVPGSITWSIASNPGKSTLSAPTLSTIGSSMVSSVNILNTVPGTYVLTAIGTSITGTIGSLSDTLVILPALAPCPAPKVPMQIVTTQVWNGSVWVLKSTVVTFNDGSTQ